MPIWSLRYHFHPGTTYRELATKSRHLPPNRRTSLPVPKNISKTELLNTADTHVVPDKVPFSILSACGKLNISFLRFQLPPNDQSLRVECADFMRNMPSARKNWNSICSMLSRSCFPRILHSGNYMINTAGGGTVHCLILHRKLLCRKF